MVDRDPTSLSDGQALPRGWHVMLFNVPTAQSLLRSDGSANLSVELPDIGFPRLMLGGRQTTFVGDIPIGARVRRETQQGPVEMKTGRSGRFAVVRVEHQILVEGESQAAVIETNDYILRPANEERPPTPIEMDAQKVSLPPAASVHKILPDSRLLFRYSAITDNPHRIHYDLRYATEVEGYPTLVVNGSIPLMFLLELFRATAGREPRRFSSRNIAPMFCDRELTLCLQPEGDEWRLWAQDPAGTTTFDARAA
jgi:3-methylfumaryl-CoA hydratase